jgi:hypothetical protein
MVSSKGYALDRLNRHQLQYKSGGKSLTIEVEAGRDLAVYLSLVQQWDEPFGTEQIGEHELAVIRDHIREGLNFLGVKCSFG